MGAIDAIQALDKETLQITLIICFGLLGIATTTIANHIRRYFSTLGERLRKLENYLARSFGYDPDE